MLKSGLSSIQYISGLASVYSHAVKDTKMCWVGWTHTSNGSFVNSFISKVTSAMKFNADKSDGQFCSEKCYFFVPDVLNSKAFSFLSLVHTESQVKWSIGKIKYFLLVIFWLVNILSWQRAYIVWMNGQWRYGVKITVIWGTWQIWSSEDHHK